MVSGTIRYLTPTTRSSVSDLRSVRRQAGAVRIPPPRRHYTGGFRRTIGELSSLRWTQQPQRRQQVVEGRACRIDRAGKLDGDLARQALGLFVPFEADEVHC
jgi:hypothetical protein